MAPPLLLDDRLSTPELMSAALDGDVRRVGWRFAPPDLPPDRELRAEALLGAVPPGSTVEGRAAGWVHGALPAPGRIVVGRAASVRPGAGPSRVVVRQVRHSPSDVEVVAGLSLTTPLRTALDLARLEAGYDLVLATAVATLLRAGGVAPHRARDVLRHAAGLPHRIRLERRLLEIERLVSRP